MRTLALMLAVAVMGCSSGSTGGGGSGGGVGGGGGGGGNVNNGKLNGAGNAIIPQGSKFLVGGQRLLPMNEADFLLARYEVDGGLDPTFGTMGSVTTSFATFENPLLTDAGFRTVQKGDGVYAVALQGTKILAAGTGASLGDLYGSFAMARYSADGVPDTTFGSMGMVQVRPSQGLGGPAHALAIRTDGKIYLGGFLSTAFQGTNGANLGLVRFTAEGQVDATFGSATGIEADFGKNEDVRGLAFQGLKVLAGGGDDFLVARYNDDGTLDTTFGTAGIATHPDGFANSFRVQSDGKLLLSGSRRTPNSGPWVIKLVRYTAEGQLDTAFGTGGALEVALDSKQMSTTGLDVLADGRIIVHMVAGFGSLSGVYPAISRFSSTGALDTAFGTNGVLDVNESLALLLGPYPPSPNRTVLVGSRLWYTDSLLAGSQTKVMFGSVVIGP